MSGITLEGVSKRYDGGVLAVDDIDLEIGSGEFVTLVGPSGCGKTTTLRTIAGFEKPTAGTVRIADDDVTAILDWEAPLAAPASMSVAKAEYLVADWYVTEPESLREAFRSGYESVRPYPSIPTTHRVAAIANTAVDSSGDVTNPGYPELGREEAVAFHRTALEAATES